MSLQAIPLLFSLVAAASPPPLRLSDLLDEVRKNNPQLLAAREMAKAAGASVEAAAALDDPMLMVQLWNAPVDFSSVPIMAQVSQTIPLGGKRWARRDVAKGQEAGARAAAAITALDLEAQVTRAYFDLFLADRALDVNAEIATALKSLQAAAISRISAGTGEQAEALRAQSELLKVQSDREAATARRTAAIAKLGAVINRPLGAEPGRTMSPGLVENLPPEEQLGERALHQRPELDAAQAQVAQADAELQLLNASKIPDLNVSLGWMHTFLTPGVSDFLFLGFQGNLPIFGGSKNAPRIEEGTAKLSARRAEVSSTSNRIVAEVAEAYAEVIAEQHQVALHHQLIPLARQALASATATYVSGRGTFLMVLDSERDLLMHGLDLASHVALYEQRLAELQRAVGGDLGLARASESPNPIGHEEPSK